MLNCKIDVNDKRTPIKLSDCYREHCRFYYEDHHNIYSKLMKHTLEMIERGLVLDDDGTVLSRNTQKVQEYLASDEVKNTAFDDALFEQLYEILETLDTPEALPLEDRWTKYYDEPDKRLFYKEEEGYPLGTVITDCVIEAEIGSVIACYDNLEICEQLLPDFYGLKVLKRVTDVKAVTYAKQKYSWPFADRDVVFHFSAVHDFRNRALLTV